MIPMKQEITSFIKAIVLIIFFGYLVTKINW